MRRRRDVNTSVSRRNHDSKSVARLAEPAGGVQVVLGRPLKVLGQLGDGRFGFAAPGFLDGMVNAGGGVPDGAGVGES